MTATPQAIAAAVAAVKAEITEDVANGIIPTTIADFSDLHSYVDANMYGGEHTDALYDDVLDHAEAARQGIDPYADIAAMQQAVEDWIKSGALLTLPGVTCTLCRVPVVYRPRMTAWTDVTDGGVYCDSGERHRTDVLTP
jgi:hypothetical protein